MAQKTEDGGERFRLYMNTEQDSLYGAKLLHDFECKFEVIQTKETSLLVNGSRSPLPILVDLEKGTAKRSLRELKNFLRCFAVPDPDGRYYTMYNPYRTDFINDKWYNDDNGLFQHAEVWCFDGSNQKIFKGSLSQSPYPVIEMLQAHWYVQRAGLKAFPDVAVWDLGNWSGFRQKANQNGHIVQKSPPTVLFADEVRALTDGEEKLVVDDHGCMYCVNYDGYFLKGGRLYRIYANMMD